MRIDLFFNSGIFRGWEHLAQAGFLAEFIERAAYLGVETIHLFLAVNYLLAGVDGRRDIDLYLSVEDIVRHRAKTLQCFAYAGTRSDLGTECQIL